MILACHVTTLLSYEMSHDMQTPALQQMFRETVPSMLLPGLVRQDVTCRLFRQVVLPAQHLLCKFMQSLIQ